jgi:oligoribonuclease NrnB/cAMP/cGMP phosphodiesterase (DHH superfamily)
VRRYRGGEPEGYFPITYGEPFPFEVIDQDEEVWIVDYSIHPSEMIRLLAITENVYWIDHHKTAIEKYDTWGVKWEVPIWGWRHDGVSGCMLTYAFLEYGMGENPEYGDVPEGYSEWMATTAPYFTKLIDDYDIWRFQYGDDTRHFEMAFGARDFSPWSGEWDEFDVHPFNGDGYFEDELIREGAIMERWRDSYAKSLMKLGFEVDWEDRHCFAVNLGRCNSDFFKSVAGNGYDVLVAFAFNGQMEKWVVSLYSEKVDVQEIAKRYGGGGHVGAAGFQCDWPPFLFEEEEAYNG